MKIKSRERSRGIYSKGGHGRKRKLKQDRWEAIRLRESNFVRIYNDQCSSKIIKTSLRNKAKQIKIKLPQTGSFNWVYYQLIEQIKYKAKLYGIDIQTY